MEKLPENLPVQGTLWEASLSYITSSSSINDHKHYCFKVAVSLDHSVNCTVDRASHIAIRGFVVNQGKKHRCAAPEGPMLNNLVEPDSLWGKRMKALLDGKDFLRFEEILDTSSISPVLPADYHHLPNTVLAGHVEMFMNKLTAVDDAASHPIDERIVRVTDYIAGHLDEKISNTTISDLTFLSFERARHLFAEQKGIPLSRYILWQRLRRVLAEVITGNTSLTAASRKFGFSDLSHFNRRFRAVFGFNPTSFLLESRVIL